MMFGCRVPVVAVKQEKPEAPSDIYVSATQRAQIRAGVGAGAGARDGARAGLCAETLTIVALLNLSDTTHIAHHICREDVLHGLGPLLQLGASGGRPFCALRANSGAINCLPAQADQ